MKNKRGLSGIIVSMLIIAFALVLVGILWFTISAVLQNSANEATSSSDRLLALASGRITSCKDVLDGGYGDEDGIYAIDPDGTGAGAPLNVYCDMTTDGGGWTLIATNDEPTTFMNFNKSWSEYADGFGEVTAPMGIGWIGNDNMHELSSGGVEMQVRTEEYNHTYLDWKVASSSDKYKMSFGTSPNSNDNGGLNQFHNGMEFSTYDRDNDEHSSNCALTYNSGWWYKECYWMSFSAGSGSTYVYWRNPSGSIYYVDYIQMWVR